MTLLLLGLAIAVMAFLLRGGDAAVRRAPAAALLLAYLLPALALTWVFATSGEDATRFRFALLGLGFRGEGARPFEVAVGGDRDQHEVWVGALGSEEGAPPLGRLVVQPAEQGEGSARVRLEAPLAAAPGLFGVRPEGGTSFRPLPAVELEEGDRVTIAGRAWALDLSPWPFGSPGTFVEQGGSGTEVPLPPRRSDVPLTSLEIPVAGELPLAQQTYPAAFLEKSVGGAPPSPRPEAFFFWYEEDLWLAAPDGSATVERGGQALEVPAGSDLAPGQRFHVLSHPRWDEREFKAGGFRDRRSFRVVPGRKSVALEYDTREVHALSWEQVEKLEITPPEAQDGDGPLRVNLAMGSWQIVDASLYFANASRKVAAEALATLELPRAAGGESFEAATPRGRSSGRFGTPVWLGGDRLAAVQLDVVQPPWQLGLLAIVLALLKAAAARSARLTVPQLLFAAALEALVVVRVLLGFRAWGMEPFSEESLRLAMVAWTLMPWGFLAACLPPVDLDRQRSDEPGLAAVLPAAGGLFFSTFWSVRFSGGEPLSLVSMVWVAVHAALLAIPFLRAFRAPRRLTEPVTRLLRGSGRVLARPFHRLAGLGARLFGPPGSERRTRWLWVLAAFAPALLRSALLLFGVKEALPIAGQRLALTLFHVPLAIGLEAAYLAWLWRRVASRGRLAGADLWPALAFVLGTWVVPAVVVSDLGLALLNVPVFLLALAVLGLAADRRAEGVGGRRLVAYLPAAALAGFVLLAVVPAGARALAFLISEETAERNQLRLLAFAYPEKLERIAKRSSEELAVMYAVMQGYTSRPFAECRYFSSELSAHLRPTALREHAVAIFLAAEWSVAGVVGVVLLFVVAGSAGLSLAPWRAEDDDGLAPARPGARWADPGLWRLVAVLSALTFAVPSVYMVLANYRLTLFTGKNPYLLGLDSTADVLEALVLAVLLGLGAAVARDAEEEP